MCCPEEHEEDMGNEKNGESLGENQGPENPDARVESLLPRSALPHMTQPFRYSRSVP